METLPVYHSFGSCETSGGTHIRDAPMGSNIRWLKLDESVAANVSYTFLRDHTLANLLVDDNGFVFFSPVLSHNSDSGFHNLISRDDRVTAAIAIIGGKDKNVMNSNEVMFNLNEVSMIGFLVAESLSHQFVRQCTFKRWERFCDMNYHVEGLFVFTFDCENSKNEALSMGFLILSNSVIIFKDWKHNFDFNYFETMSNFVWVTLNIPLFLMSKKGIGYIIGVIGKVICSEQMTPDMVMEQGAKMLVQLDCISHKPSCF
ncbi:hypothetical protein POM88_047292 [Heracleum sosnowskyi]|uniref:DUF4283 domain-containing protein n=1 Tax=Heracleum sosnowskyi TaxID=360622 RepID=A0AAD8GSY7_9APIA|nr:hypothetical protein POM88_047292 [Heracleum sosnowskyi]